MSVCITAVQKHSLAEKAKIKPNDFLLSINDNEITDVLDYMFYVSEQDLKLEIMRTSTKFIINITKSEYDDLGLEFSSFLMDEKRSCKNKCVFCFIDQMPPNMRETLYFKDDDARLSFLHGNYVTLTNLSDKDIDRIIKMRLNINVSVHTTNPALRVEMMNNRFAGEKLSYLKKLADAGIMMNCQIVLCPNINDGEELIHSLSDLAKLSPAIQSIAVVPVGITKFRDGLYPLTVFTKESAGKTLDIIETMQNKFLNEFKTRLVFPADEFFLKAERNIPEKEFYEDYPQYENGVGLIRVFTDEFNEAIEVTEYDNTKREVSIATGFASYNFLLKLIEKVNKKWHNFNCNIYAIKNDFFGENITVAGLITGIDLINQLKGLALGETLFIPNVMLKQDSNVFLDDITVDDVEKAISIKIIAVPNDGFELLNAILYK